MTSRAALLAVFLLALPGLAEAACFADYKAKRDDPLRLHYGVVKLTDGDCPDARSAANDIARRIARDGWELLNVVSLFGEGAVEEKRASAGDFFLRY